MTQRAWRRPPGSPTLTQIARAAGVPVPVVSKVLNGRSDVSPSVRDSVAEQLRLAGYAPVAPVKASAPDALLDLVVSAVEGTWANVMLSGIEGAAAETGLDVVVVLAREGVPEERDWVQRLIDRGSKGAVLALVAPTTAEFGVFDAAAERGLRIPHDLSVVGFDDLPEARWLSPGLTTIRQPVREMAELAARTLLRLIDGERLQVPRVELQTRLVERGSTCPPGARAPLPDSQDG